MISFRNTYYDIRKHHNHTLKFLNSSISFIDITTVQKRLADKGGDAYKNFLTEWEKSYLDSLKLVKRKTDFLCGRLAGKRAVRRQIIKNRTQHQNIQFNDIEIKRTVTGRPAVFIKDGSSRNGASDFFVSISHTQGVAASLVCNKNACKGIGIDIEKIEAKDNSLLNVAFTDFEIQRLKEFILKGNGRGNELFEENIARYWSIKEAVMKSLGVGVNIDLKDFVVNEAGLYTADVSLKNEALDRFNLLQGRELKVEATRIDNFMISIACLY